VVYVSDTTGFSGVGGVLRVFTPDAILQASTETANHIAPSSATVTGVVNPNGNPTQDCHFEYGPTDSYGQSAPCTTNPGDNASIRTPVSADLSGLDSDTTIHYKVVEKTSEGTVSGDDQTFTTTTPPSPSATTGKASALSQHKASVDGTVNPQGGVTTCEFEYGTDTSYGSSVPCASDPGSDSNDVSVSADLSGLSPNTTYHFRLSATNAGGTTHGDDATFTTSADTCQSNAALCPPPPPTCETDASLCPKPPLKCRKGFKKATKHGKQVCVKVKKHHHKKHRH
jgi:hypothetical protein